MEPQHMIGANSLLNEVTHPENISLAKALQRL